MSVIPLITTCLKAFAAFWSLILFAVSASFIAKSNSYFGSGPVNESNFAAGNALIAGGVIFIIYLGVALFFIFRSPDNMFISVMIDTIMLGIFFIYFLGATAALSTEARFFAYWDEVDTWAALGNAVLGLGWVMTFLILAILLLEVIYTLKHFGRDYPTWRTPFNQLVEYGTPGSRTGATTQPGVAMNNVTSPASATQTTNTFPAQSGDQAYPAQTPLQATGNTHQTGEHHILPQTYPSHQPQHDQINEKLSPYQGPLHPGSAV
ncbi:uncharacterized protein IL334_002096 [Kwoniella shivajii]|uniref:MARVEL domain-containing protein n=1 Tax=Kwoniella shivajii TaxID=564305 RepID=A0ABZ1CTR8_9TREE|nr:hypothetical protein IL334_002096 [Kwoniella shivajii]